MADRYWVGGTGTWNTTSTTNWSASSGGPSGASVPTVADSVFFDQAASYTITMTGALACLNINVSAGTVTFQDGTTPTLNVRGSISLIAGTIWNTTGLITCSAVDSRTITSAGVTINSPITFNGTNGIWTLQDNLTLPSTRTVTLTTGTLALSSYTLTTGLFSGTGTSARTLNFGTGKIVLNSATTSTIWTTATVTNLTVSGTPLVECQGGGTAVTKTVTTGALSEANSISFSFLETTGTVTYTLTAANVFRNLIFNGTQTITNSALTIFGSFSNPTTSGTTNFSSGTSAYTFAATSGNYNISPSTATGISGQGSVYVSSANYLNVNGAQTALSFGTGDFTIECWTFLSGAPASYAAFVETRNVTSAAYAFGVNSTSKLDFYYGSAGRVTSTSSVPTGQWVHCAVTRTSGTIRLFINGVLDATTGTFASAINATRTVPIIGALIDPIYFNGYISNLRVVKGAVVYTGTFTPPTLAPLATSGASSASAYPSTTNVNTSFLASTTSLLTCQSTTLFVDNSVNAFSITATGTPIAIALAPNSQIYDFPWTFGSASSTATWTLQDQLNISNGRTLTWTNGTLDYNNRTLLGTSGITIVTGTFNLNNTGGTTVSTIVPITHTSGTLNLGTNLTTTNATGYTLTAGALALSTFTLTTPIFSSSNANTRTINFGTGKIVLDGAVTATIWTTATVTGLTVTGTPLVECIGGGTAVTKTINTGALSEANAISFSLLNTTGTVTYAFTASNVVRNLITNGLQTVSNIAILIYESFTHSTTNGTTTFTAGANAWTFAATSGSYSITNIAGFTYDFPWIFGSATSTAIWTLVNNLTLGATRQLTLTNGTTDFNSKTLSAAGITILTGTPTIANTGTVDFTTTLPITHTSGTFTLTINVTTTNATGYTLTAGTLALSTFTLTTPVFSSNNSNTRTINFGTGKIALNGGTGVTIWNTATVTGMTTSGTQLVECVSSGAGTRTISAGALSAANTISFSLLGSSSCTFAFTASNNIRNLIVNGTQTVSNIAINIFGDFTHLTASGTTTFTAGTNAWTFAATTGSYNITNIAGFTYDFPWTFGSAASTAIWTIANNLVIGSAATRQVTLTNGTVDFNNKTLTGNFGITVVTGSATLTNTGASVFSVAGAVTHTSGTLNLGVNFTTTAATGYTFTAGTLVLSTFTLTTTVFNSNNANARTLNFGTGQLALSGNNATIFDITTATNFATTGTVYINSTYTGATGTRTFVTGLSEAQSVGYDVKTSGTTGIVIGTTATDSVALTGNFEDIDLTGLTNTILNTARILYGNLTIPASGGTLTAGANATTFSGAGTENITTNGRTLDFPITINGTGTTQLVDNLTLGSTRTFTLTAGTFNLNNLILTAQNFSSSNSNTRVLAFGTTGQFVSAATNNTIWDNSTATNFTYTGTPRIYSTYTGAVGTRTFNVAVTAGATVTNIFDVSIGTTGTGIVIAAATDTIALAGYFNNFNLTGLTNIVSNATRVIYGNTVIPNSGGTLTAGTLVTTLSSTATSTITSNGRTLDFPITIGDLSGSTGTVQLADSLTIGSTRTLTLTYGTIDTNNFTVSTGQFNSSNSNNRVINFGTTGQLTLVNSGTLVTIWDTTTGTNFSYTGTSRVFASFSGATVSRVVAFGTLSPTYAFNIKFASSAQENAFTFNTSSDVLQISGPVNNFDFTGSTNTIGVLPTVYGNFTVPATGGTLPTTSTALTFAGTSGTKTISAGRTLNFPITFNGQGSTFQLAGSLTLTAGVTTNVITLTAGILDLNNNTITAYALVSNNTNIRSILFGTSGQFILTGNNVTVVDFTNATNFTYTGTAKITSNYTGATGTRTFNFGGTAGAFPDNVFNVSITGSTGLIIAAATDTIALTGSFGDITLTGLTSTLSNTLRTSYGNLTVPASGGTLTAGANATTLSAPSTAPASTAYSVYFDGTGDFLNTPSDTAFTFGTGDLTLECWIYQTAISTATYRVIFSDNLYPSAGGYALYTYNNALNLWRGGVEIIAPAGTISLNTWTHVAWTRSGSSNRLFINGTQVGATTTDSGNYTAPISYIGARLTAPGFPFAGHISNARIVKGIAVYTDNFTPSTSPLTTTSQGVTASNVSLLVCQNNTFIDNSTNNFAITVNGNVTPSYLSPFSGQTSTTKTITTNGRTLDFPITIGDFISGTGINQLAGALTLGATRALTLTNNTLDLNNLTVSALSFNSTNINIRSILFGTSGQITVVGSGATLVDISTATNFTWTGTSKIVSTYAAGTGTRTFLVGSVVAIAEEYAFDVIIGTGSGINLSASATDSLALTGQFANFDLRNMAGSTATLTNTARTIFGNFFMPTTNGTFTAGTAVTTFGSTNASTRTITTSARTLDFPITFNGIGGTWQLQDNLVIGATRILTWTNGTLDVNNRTLTGTVGVTINGGTFTLNNTGGTTFSVTVPITHTTGILNLGTNFTTTSTTGYTLTAGTLVLSTYTLATPVFSSSNSNIRTINFGTGKIQLTANTTVTMWNTSTVTNFSYTGTSNVESIGGGDAVTKTINTGTMSESQALNWTFDEVAGSAVTTILFTASNAVKNLTLSDTNGGRYQLTNIAITIYGDYNYGGSYTSGYVGVFFDGTGDYLSIPNNSTFNFGTGDFTVEFWIYPTSAKLAQLYDNANSTGSAVAGLFINWNTTSFITAGQAFGSAVATSTAVTLNVWTHVAVVRNAGAWTIYLNGVSAGTGSSSVNLTATGPVTIGGNARNTAESLLGNISNLRVVSGTALYTSTFTPSTTPLTAISGTSLLTCQSAMDIVDNSANKFPITVNGNTFASFVNPFNNLNFPLVFSGTNAWTFGSTSTQTITSGGLTHDMPITFAGTGTYTLQDSLNVGITRTTTLTSGTIDLTDLVLATGLFASNNPNSRSINFGTTGKIQLKASTAVTYWNTATATGLGYTGSGNVETIGSGSVTKTITAGAGSISRTIASSDYQSQGWVSASTDYSGLTGAFSYSTGSLQRFSGGARSIPLAIDQNYYFEVLISTWSAYPIVGLIRDTDVGGYDGNPHISLYLGTPGGGMAGSSIGVFSNGDILQVAYKPGTSKYYLGRNNTWNQDPSTTEGSTIPGTGNIRFIFTSGSSTGANATGIFRSAAQNTYSPPAGYSALSASAIPTPFNFNLKDVAGTITVSSGSYVNDLTINGSFTLTNSALNLYGDYTYTTATALTAGSNAWTFSGTIGTQNISATTVTHDFPWTFNGAGETFLLQSAITIGSTRTTTLTNGTLDLNGYTYTSGLFTTAAGTKSIIADGGTFAITGSGATAWNNANPTGFSVTTGSAIGTISMTSASAKTFVGGGSNYSGLKLNQGGTGTLTVTGSNTFEDLSASITSSANSTVSFTAGTTTTFNTFTTTGTSSFKPTLNSATTGSTATFYNAAGLTGFITGADYIICRDIAFTPFATNGTDYMRWYIGGNSVILNNASGALVQTYTEGISSKVYVIESGSTWTVPEDFNRSNNTIHLIGGGGGGAGSRGTTGSAFSGSGGGGGGYTRATNASLTGVISYSVGTGGGGGSGSSAAVGSGTNGVTTTFATFSAGGGAAGTTAGGAGGAGTTFNGGAGGNGVNSSLGGAVSGGGGGGAGGPLGIGAQGGTSSSSGASNCGGAGGGGNGGGTVGGPGAAFTGFGNGGNNNAGAGGAISAGASGTQGGGGAGGTSSAGGVGGHGIDILNSLGGGGGGGGGGAGNGPLATAGGLGGKYGGGGGGAGSARGGNPGFANGAAGANGVIIIVYLPGTAPLTTGNFLMLFM